MKVLVITGDKSFGPEHPRFDLQAKNVEKISAVFCGRGKGNIWPKTPKEEFDVVTSQDPFWRGFFAWYVARRRLGAKFNVQVHTDLFAQSFPEGRQAIERACAFLDFVQNSVRD